MHIKLTVALPRDALSIPVVRRMLTTAMASLGVTDECARDVQLALTEACTNVLDHAHADDVYEVCAAIDDHVCVIEVVDRGSGFDSSTVGLSDASLEAEAGRGVQLMRAFADRVEFGGRPESGTVVHLEKQLRWRAGAPLRRAGDRGPAR